MVGELEELEVKLEAVIRSNFESEEKFTTLQDDIYIVKDRYTLGKRVEEDLRTRIAGLRLRC